MSKDLLDRLARVESRLCQLFYFLGGNPHAKYDAKPPVGADGRSSAFTADGGVQSADATNLSTGTAAGHNNRNDNAK